MRAQLIDFECCKWANGDYCSHKDNIGPCWNYPDYKNCEFAKEYYQNLGEKVNGKN